MDRFLACWTSFVFLLLLLFFFFFFNVGICILVLLFCYCIYASLGSSTINFVVVVANIIVSYFIVAVVFLTWQHPEQHMATPRTLLWICAVYTHHLIDWMVAWLGWLFDSAAVSDPERPVAEHSAGVQDGPQGQGGRQASFSFCVPRPWRVVASHGFSADRGEALVLLLLLMVVGMVATLNSGGWSWTLSRRRWGISAVVAVNDGRHGDDPEEWRLVVNSQQAEVRHWCCCCC